MPMRCSLTFVLYRNRELNKLCSLPEIAFAQARGVGVGKLAETGCHPVGEPRSSR